MTAEASRGRHGMDCRVEPGNDDEGVGTPHGPAKSPLVSPGRHDRFLTNRFAFLDKMPAVECRFGRVSRMAAYRRSGAFARLARVAFIGFALSGLAACGHLLGGNLRDRDCMARVMYFESIRSSDEGMLAVGTVVMNRVGSNKYPNSVCAVVGQPNQFAPGALSNPMPAGASRDRAYHVADQVLRGRRHRGVGKAMFFHTAGRTYGYSNMHYVAVAGGNAFYERQQTGRAYIPRSVIAAAGPLDSVSAPRWFLGSGYRVVTETPEPQQPAPVYAAAPSQQPGYVGVPQPRPAYVEAPQPLPPTSIEAIILASNGLLS